MKSRVELKKIVHNSEQALTMTLNILANVVRHISANHLQNVLLCLKNVVD